MQALVIYRLDIKVHGREDMSLKKAWRGSASNGGQQRPFTKPIHHLHLPASLYPFLSCLRINPDRTGLAACHCHSTRISKNIRRCPSPIHHATLISSPLFCHKHPHTTLLALRSYEAPALSVSLSYPSIGHADPAGLIKVARSHGDGASPGIAPKVGSVS